MVMFSGSAAEFRRNRIRPKAIRLALPGRAVTHAKPAAGCCRNPLAPSPPSPSLSRLGSCACSSLSWRGVAWRGVAAVHLVGASLAKAELSGSAVLFVLSVLNAAVVFVAAARRGAMASSRRQQYSGSAGGRPKV